MHGTDWSGHRIDGWIAQEKFDGWRACWTGSRLITRNGHPYTPPDWFLAGLPPCPLDCELYAGPGQRARLARLQRGDDWQVVSLLIFDRPDAPGGILERLAGIPAPLPLHTMMAPTWRVGSTAEALTLFASVQSRGGEGLMLRHPAAPYRAGRVDTLLKIKS